MTDELPWRITHWRPLPLPPAAPEGGGVEQPDPDIHPHGLIESAIELIESDGDQALERVMAVDLLKEALTYTMPVTRAEFDALKGEIEKLRRAASEAGWFDHGWLT